MPNSFFRVYAVRNELLKFLKNRPQESTDRGDEHVGTDHTLDYGRNPSLTAGALIGRERLGKLTRSRLRRSDVGD